MSQEVAAPPPEAAAPEAPPVEAEGSPSVAEALDGDDGTEAPEATESGEQAAKPPKRRRSPSEYRAERIARKQQAAAQREFAEAKAAREQAQRELQELKAEREQWRQRLKDDPFGVLQQDLEIPREELLARQAEEQDVPPQIRRHIMALERKLAEVDKRYNDELSKRDQQARQQQFQQSVGSDVEWMADAASDAERWPNLAMLPRKQRAEYARKAVLQAVNDGDGSATRPSLLDEIEDEIAEWVQHVRQYGRDAEREPVAPAAAAAKPRARAASARGAAAPSQATPRTEQERREAAMSLARARRKAREDAKRKANA